MTPDNTDISAAIGVRSRLRQRLAEKETAQQRLVRFVRLQQVSFQLLQSSPAGFRHFLQRNLHSRRVEVINGKWRPIAADRRACEA